MTTLRAFRPLRQLCHYPSLPTTTTAVASSSFSSSSSFFFPSPLSTRLAIPSLSHSPLIPSTHRFFFNLPTNLPATTTQSTPSSASISTSTTSTASTASTTTTTTSSARNPSFQTLTASRKLPYPAEPLYEIICDIDSYSKFIPYCTESYVTKHSSTTTNPSEATLHIGLTQPFAFSESFSSIVTCRPYNSVVADASSSPLFDRLQTKWEVKELGDGQTSEVSLRIEFAFKNPLYNVLVGGVAPKVAGAIVEAFETRVGEVMKQKGKL